MPFKHGKLAELYLGAVDVSTYFAGADFDVKTDTAEVSTFKAPGNYKSYIPGASAVAFSASGYYDSADADKVRDILQVAGGVLTYFPSGGTTLGDQARLISINSTDYKTGSKIGGAVTMDWTVASTAGVGIGVSLLPLQVQAVGTNTGTGDACLRDGTTQTTGGAVATAHVTAYTSGSQTIKFQDATTLGGAYTDIASGAFPAITATGGYRLVIPGTIRQFVKCVTIIAGAQITCAVTFART